jgi:effector-binding domain-containing protein/DNA-binding transcriptional MerR regulator
MDNLIPIGRFSRVCRLSIKSLRRYADDDLLAPEWIDPSSGYRYYTYAQVTQAEVIRLLRTLEMPLEEIREVLEATDSDRVSDVLDHHRARLEGQLDHYSRMLGFLRQLIQDGGSPMSYDVVIKELPAQHVAVFRTRIGPTDAGPIVAAGFGTLAGAIAQVGAEFAGPPYLVMTEMPDPETGGAIELAAPVIEPFSGCGDVTGEELPAILVASTMHRGPYEECGPAYKAIEAWIQSHGHASVGPPREIYLTNPQETPDPADFETEIQFPIAVPN